MYASISAERQHISSQSLQNCLLGKLLFLVLFFTAADAKAITLETCRSVLQILMILHFKVFSLFG